MQDDQVSALRFRPVMVIDGQWGSTGKGLIAGYLALKKQPKAVVCNFGPNAGHTLQFKDGTPPLITRMLPTSGLIASSVRDIFIGPGAVVDVDILVKECLDNLVLLQDKRIWVHERAVRVLDRHKKVEASALVHIASTRKGTGAAISDKVMRFSDTIMKAGTRPQMFSVLCDADYLHRLGPYVESGSLIIESSQGFELGINTGSHYPHCTSRDITPVQILSDCGISWLVRCYIVASMRTYPIRVGNEVRDGEQVGYSGDVYPDQKEISFEDLGVEDERTTVTKKVRRIFTWSDINLRRVMERVRPNAMFLNFVNYLEKEPSFKTNHTSHHVARIEAIASGYRRGMPLVRWIGTGPCIPDVIEHLSFIKRERAGG